MENKIFQRAYCALSNKIFGMRIVVVVTVLSLLVTSCNFKKKEASASHFPFQKSEGGYWGLLGVDGKILIEDEFKGKPTPVVDGCFFVRNSNGNYELYDIDDPKRAIGENYVDIAMFNEGLAPVVKEGEGISFINRKGEVLFELPHEYLKAISVSEGLSAVMNEDDKVGFVNMKGEVIIKPQYLHATSFVNDHAFVFDENNGFYCIDKTGRKVFEMNDGFYSINKQGNQFLEKFGKQDQLISQNVAIWNRGIREDLIPYITKNEIFGVKNSKGEVVIEALDKYKGIYGFRNGYSIFRTERGYGVINKKGEVKIPDKYDEIAFCDGIVAVVCREGKWGIISMDEERLCSFKYERLFAIENSSYFIGFRNENYYLITKEGEEKGKYQAIDWEMDNIVESDYFSGSRFAKQLLDLNHTIGDVIIEGNDHFGPNLYGFLGMTPEECVDVLKIADLSVINIVSNLGNRFLPSTYLFSTDYASVSISPHFPEVVVTMYNSYFFSNEVCNAIVIDVTVYDKYVKYMDLIHKGFVSELKEMGYEKRESHLPLEAYENAASRTVIQITDFGTSKDNLIKILVSKMK